MKKSIFLSLALASVATFAHAQDAGGFRIGVKAGATYSNVSGDDVSQFTGSNYDASLGSYKLGYNAGLSLSVPLSSDGFFSLQPELLYNRKGYEIQTQSKSGANLTAYGTNVSKVEQEQQRVLHYIDLPILAKIRAGGLTFQLGPQVSYLFGSRVKNQTTVKYSDGTKDKTEDRSDFVDYLGGIRGEKYKGDLSNVDISGVAGVGYMTEGGLSLDLRYARGFNSLIDSKDTKVDPKAFNNAFTLQLGYLIPTK